VSVVTVIEYSNGPVWALIARVRGLGWAVLGFVMGDRPRSVQSLRWVPVITSRPRRRPPQRLPLSLTVTAALPRHCGPPELYIYRAHGTLIRSRLSPSATCGLGWGLKASAASGVLREGTALPKERRDQAGYGANLFCSFFWIGF
jgi:hypothetical protein